MSSDGGGVDGAGGDGNRPKKTGSPTPVGGQPASALVIGKAFIKQYYHTLSSSPRSIHKFYKQTSVLSHGLEASAPARPVLLRDVLESAEDGGMRISSRDGLFTWADPPEDDPSEVVRFDFGMGAIDAQETVNGGILLVVTGHMTLPAEHRARPFVHTFFLNNAAPAGKKRQFYVHNDVLRFLADGGDPGRAEEAMARDTGVSPMAISPVTAPAPAEEVEVEAEESADAPRAAAAPEIRPEPAAVEVVPAAVEVAEAEQPPAPVPPAPKDKPVDAAPAVPEIEAEPAAEESKEGALDPEAVVVEVSPAMATAAAEAAEDSKEHPAKLAPSASASQAKQERKDASPGSDRQKDRRRPKPRGSRGSRGGGRGGGGGGGGGGKDRSRSSSPASKPSHTDESAKVDAEKAAAKVVADASSSSERTAAPASSDRDHRSRKQQQQPRAPSPAKVKAPGSWASLVATGGSGGSVPLSPARSAAGASVGGLPPAVPFADGGGAAEESKEDPPPLVPAPTKPKEAKEEGSGSSSATAAADAAGAAAAIGTKGGPGPEKAAPSGPEGAGGPGPRGRVPPGPRGPPGLRSPDATLFIKNVPDRTREHDMRDLFNPYGNIVGITLVAPRGFCFVDYDSTTAVDAVLRDRDADGGRNHPFRVHGRSLDVGRKVPDKNRRGPAPGDDGWDGGGRGMPHRGHHRHRSASPGNGGLYNGGPGGGGRGGGHRRPSPRGGGRERRDGNGGRGGPGGR